MLEQIWNYSRFDNLLSILIRSATYAVEFATEIYVQIIRDNVEDFSKHDLSIQITHLHERAFPQQC